MAIYLHISFVCVFLLSYVGERLDRIENAVIRGRVKVGELVREIRESRLRWFGHVERRDGSM